jgi:hypothetical protein
VVVPHPVNSSDDINAVTDTSDFILAKLLSWVKFEGLVSLDRQDFGEDEVSTIKNTHQERFVALLA